jgi:hypothetical protein
MDSGEFGELIARDDAAIAELLKPQLSAMRAALPCRSSNLMSR